MQEQIRVSEGAMSRENQPVRVNISTLQLALAWLEYIAGIKSADGGGGWPPFFVEPSDHSPWGFTRDTRRLQQLMLKTLGVPIPHDRDVYLPFNIGCGWDGYYKKHWRTFHGFLRDNFGEHETTSLDVAAMFSQTDSSTKSQHDDEDEESSRGPYASHRRMRTLLQRIERGNISLKDLEARPADKED